jgi:hypothetical protein
VAFSCDKCPETFEAETFVLRDAWAEAQSAGWVTWRWKSGIYHACGECASSGLVTADGGVS